MAITRRAPQIRVTLNGRDYQRDLTPLLGDQGSVTVQRSLYAAAGTATLVFTDRMDPARQDSIYGLISVMDGIVIRMASDGDPAVVMRGYVTSVSRSEVFSSDGRPQRSVTVIIQDSGKLFLNVQVFYLKQYLTGVGLLTKFKFHEATGIDYRPLPAGEFMREILTLVNDYVENFWYTAPGIDANFVEPDITVTEGVVQPFGVDASQGSIWQIMTGEADAPFNELFVEDRENAPYLVYRPTPFKDAGGAWIPQGGQAVSAASVEVPLRDVKSISVHRGDADVANFYWVRLQGSMVFKDTAILADALQNESDTVYQQGYPNNDPAVFGDRKLETASRQGPPNQETSYGNIPEPEAIEVQQAVLEWMQQRRETLRAFNQDNSVFEGGSITLRGNPALRHGRYLVIQRGGIRSEYYIHAVTHQFSPFREYTTKCEVSRGTGFIARRAAGAPYLAEGRRGAYS